MHETMDRPVSYRAPVAIVLILLFAATCLPALTRASGNVDEGPADDWTKAPEVPGPVGDHLYHRHPDMTMELEDLVDANPGLMELTSMGDSVAGLELWNVHITNFANDTPKLAIYLDGGHHGNEYLSVELAMMFINHLLDNYGLDERITHLVDHTDIHVTPMINPDGNTVDTRHNANDIDLNRNYPFMFEPGGSHGDEPASEPEVAANVAFLSSHNLSLYITGHSGIVRLLYPWGYTENRTADQPLFRKIGETTEDIYGIRTCQTARCLYQNRGTSRDFGYGALGIPTLTFEVDDEQFAPASYEDIESRLSQEFEVLMWLAFAAGEMRAKPVSVNEGLTYGENNRFSLIYSITNKGWAPLANATASIHSNKQMKVLGNATQTVTVMPGTATYIFFDVELVNEGRHYIQMRLDYNLTAMANGTNATHIVTNSIYMEEEHWWNTEWFFVMLGLISATVVAAGVGYHIRRRKETKEILDAD